MTRELAVKLDANVADATPSVVDASGATVDLFAVEYQFQGRRWRPHSIVTRKDTWDACWSRKQGLLVHSSGGGQYGGEAYWLSGYVEPKKCPGRIWTVPGLALECWGGDGKPNVSVDEQRLRRMGYKRFAKLPGNPFEDAWYVEGHIDYCSICRDHYDDAPEGPCKHLQWSDEAAQCIGSGADYDSECKPYVERGLATLCAQLGRDGAEQLRRDVVASSVGYRDKLYDVLRKVEDSVTETRCRTAVAWLWSLSKSRSKPMQEAVQRTLRCLDDWLRSSGLRVGATENSG